MMVSTISSGMMRVLLSMQVAGTVVVDLLRLLLPYRQVVHHPSYRDPSGVLESRQEELLSNSQYLECSFIVQCRDRVTRSQGALSLRGRSKTSTWTTKVTKIAKCSAVFLPRDATQSSVLLPYIVRLALCPSVCP